ncbi:branched-chain amino acid ABC transporter permease/ATP-binding protein [Nocardia vinacea]|uniref:branched-chain amino acid ABC transporter permease/ATP-binding protein n=1 Tax=Nocardia vinacea TaxID=96468 RepID=UPI0002D2997A|nr:branched-chain amino acid ABC transporter permease/ATP-binding protein [Nocardia vinacea]
MLPFIVAGLTTGSIFALAGVGLVLTYKTSGIFNFGHGALASASAFLFYFLHDQHDLPWPVAAGICIVLGGPLVGLLLEWIARHLAMVSLSMKVLATVGVLLFVQGGLELLFPPGPSRQVRQFLPTAGVHLGDTAIAGYQLIIFGIGVSCVVALTAFLRYSRTGLAMRAVVDNAELLDVMGIPPVRIRRLAWAIGSTMAAASGVLLAPLLPLDATTMTFLVVTAFGAAAVGAFTNLPVTYLGGLGIGVGQALLQKYFVASTGLAGGLSSSLPFLILFGLLLVAPRLRRPSISGHPHMAARSSWRAPWTVRTGGTVALLAALVAVPQFAGFHMVEWTRFLAYVVLFLSLGLLVRMSGQVSLAHVSFMAIGVAAFSHIAVDRDWPWFVALLAAASIAAPIGAVLAIPAIRFPGLYLALATLGFGILLQQMFYTQPYMFGTLGFGLSIPRPHLSWIDIDSDRGYYYFVLAVTVVIAAIVVVLTRSRLGRLLRAMADSSTGLAATGASINVSRVLVFCLSASLAAVAGVLDGAAIGIVGGDGYQPMLSLLLFALILLTVGPPLWYSVLAAAGQVVVPAYISTGPTVGYAFTALFGVGAVLLSIAPENVRQLPLTIRQLIDRLGPAAKTPSSASPVGIPHRSNADPASVNGRGSGLAVEKLIVRYGGVVAVDQVDLIAPPGKITGLIGPNGAGKSTVFNACSGLLDPDGGEILLDNRRIRRLGPPARARRGIGRTFQHMELFDSLTTRQNLEMGCEGAFAGWNPANHLVSRPGQQALVRSRGDHALELCGLADVADDRVGTLSTGQRRLVELARCVAGSYEVLLLDEPSSGLDRIETERFGAILKRIVREQRVGILLIEHDMALVNSLCDYVYVIDFGKPIFEGTVRETQLSPIVRKAYLGEDDLPEVRSLELGGQPA